MKGVPDFDAQRTEFLNYAQQSGGIVESMPLTCRGPSGQLLSIDVVTFGSANPSQVLLHVAGTHGVEGYLGADIQRRCLDRIGTLGPTQAVIFVRCLNPWGMAHLRRVNSENIDLNRNFLSGQGSFQGMPPGYRALQSWLNPERSPLRWEPFYDRVLYYVARYGFQALKQAIGAGQYELPRGIYFGGKEPTEEARLFSGWLSRRLTTAERVWGLEVHSGLGPYGYDTLFLTTPAGNRSNVQSQVEAITGHPVASEDPDKGVGFTTQGDLAKFVVTERGSLETVWLLQEFGTYHPVSVLKALRNENMHHHYGGGVLDHWSKLALLKAFYPHDPAWRAHVIERGVALFQQSLAALSQAT